MFDSQQCVCLLVQFLLTSNIPFSALIIVAIAVDRYVCICHPLRYATLATAFRARVVVLVLALLALVLGLLACSQSRSARVLTLLALILGLLGAAGFSVYHTVTFPVLTTPDSQPDHVTRSSSFVSDEPPEVYYDDSCVTGSNETACSLTHVLLNTGLCARSDLILSPSFLDGYLIVHTLIYPLCLLAVLVLYSLIYRMVLARRARRLRMRGSGVALTPTPAPPPPAQLDKSTPGTSLELQT